MKATIRIDVKYDREVTSREKIVDSLGRAVEQGALGPGVLLAVTGDRPPRKRK